MAVFSADPTTATMALFGKPSNQLQEYMASTVNNFAATVGQSAASTVSFVTERFNDFRTGKTFRKLEAVRNKLNNFWEVDSVRTLSNVGMIQNAPDEMVRWVMAHPGMQQAYIDNRTEGYGDRYINTDPGKVGKFHRDYRLATHGVVVRTPVKGNVHYDASTYFDPMVDEAYNLSVLDKACIANTYDVLTDCLANGDADPASEWNGLLG